MTFDWPVMCGLLHFIAQRWAWEYCNLMPGPFFAGQCCCYFLACTAGMPCGLYFLLMFFSIFNIMFSGQTSHPIISGSSGPIFTKLSPYGSYLVVDFLILKERCHGNQF